MIVAALVAVLAVMPAYAQEVSFIASELNDDTLSREEYVIVFYGGIN